MAGPATPQGKGPINPSLPSFTGRQSSTGTGQDNRVPPAMDGMNPTASPWGGHLQDQANDTDGSFPNSSG